MGTGDLHIINMMAPLTVSGCQVHMQFGGGGGGGGGASSSAKSNCSEG